MALHCPSKVAAVILISPRAESIFSLSKGMNTPNPPNSSVSSTCMEIPSMAMLSPELIFTMSSTKHSLVMARIKIRLDGSHLKISSPTAALSMYCSREERFLHIQLIVPLLSISKTVVFTLEIAWYISLIIRLTVFANSSVINVPPFLNLS